MLLEAEREEQDKVDEPEEDVQPAGGREHIQLQSANYLNAVFAQRSDGGLENGTHHEAKDLRQGDYGDGSSSLREAGGCRQIGSGCCYVGWKLNQIKFKMSFVCDIIKTVALSQ